MTKQEAVNVIKKVLEETDDGNEDFLEFLEYELDHHDNPMSLETFLITVFKEFIKE